MKSGPYHGLGDLGCGPTDSLTSSPAPWPHSLCSSPLALSQLWAFALAILSARSTLPAPGSRLHPLTSSQVFSPPSPSNRPSLCSCYSLPTWLYFLLIFVLFHHPLYIASLFTVCLLHQNVSPMRAGDLFCLTLLWTECLCRHPTPALRFICWSPNPQCDDIWRWDLL